MAERKNNKVQIKLLKSPRDTEHHKDNALASLMDMEQATKRNAEECILPPLVSNCLPALPPSDQGSRAGTGSRSRLPRDSRYCYNEWWGETTTTTTTKTMTRKGFFFASLDDEHLKKDNEGHSTHEQRSTTTALTKGFWRYRPTGNKGLDRFRKIVDFILIARQIFNCHGPGQLTSEERLLFFLDVPITTPEVSTPYNGHMIFDVTSFKGIKEKKTISSVKELLEVPIGERTQQDVTKMMHNLQSFSKFAGYPVTAQSRICQHGWYARFEATRVLCRQDQKAEVYYFVLSGIAVSRRVEPGGDGHNPQHTHVIRTGDTIGEKELLNSTQRESTIVTKEALEVLGLDKQDFLDIFHENLGDSKENIQLLKSIDVLADFPMDLLHTKHFACSVHTYRRGSVIVRNSNDSEWIYVVKSGSCQVYKTVKSVRSRDRKRAQMIQPDVTETLDAQKGPSSVILPRIQQGIPNLTGSGGSSEGDPVKTTEQRRLSICGDDVLHLPSITTGDERRLTCMGLDNRCNSCLDKSAKMGSPHRQVTIRKKESLRGHCPSQPPLTTVYAKLEVLPEHSVFGLQSIIYDDSPSFTLVSNGTECILLSKQFLLDHLDSSVLINLRKKVPPYPSLASIQHALDSRVLWDGYKHKVVMETLQ